MSRTNRKVPLQTTSSVTNEDGETTFASTSSIVAGAPEEMSLPVRHLQPLQGLALGFRQSMVEVEEIDASVSTTAGLGTDFIIVTYDERTMFLRGSELLKRYVTSIDPKVGDNIPGFG